MSETLEAGRELDALVAEKVMGWTDVSVAWRKIGRVTHCAPHGRPPEQLPDSYLNGYAQLPDYSTDIAAAWKVVEKMRATHSVQVAAIDMGEDDEIPMWWVCMEPQMDIPSNIGHIGQTAPLAICLAALKAVGE